MGKKLTIEFVKDSFEKEGWICTSEKYVNAFSKLNYICPEGHHGSIVWSDWQQGKRCPICAGNKKLTIEFIKSEFEKENWACLSDEYINAFSKLNYICSNGHKGTITWNNWQRGNRCSICAGNKKYTIEFIKLEFEKKNWMCLSNEYINSNSKLNYICSNGHKGTITWRDWQQGKRCAICAGVKKLTIEFVKSEFGKEGWICTSEKYINSKTNINYICSNGHHGSITWSHWRQGRRCPKCSMNGTSIWEATIKKFVCTINKNFLENDRTQILNPNTNRYLELDLWFPDLNKAIECNGVYWHSKKDRKDMDKLKQEWCKTNNVSLLVVTDTDWNKDIEKCQKKIEKFLN